MWVTFLPNVSDSARLRRAWSFAPRNYHIFGGAYDLVFSGHVGLMLSVIHALNTVFPTAVAIIRIARVAMYSVSVLVVLTRNHYTIDVIVAFLAVEVCKHGMSIP